MLRYEPARDVEAVFCRTFADDDPKAPPGDGALIALSEAGADAPVTGGNRDAYPRGVKSPFFGRRRLHGMSAFLFRPSPPPRNAHVPAAASPRPASTDCPRPPPAASAEYARRYVVALCDYRLRGAVSAQFDRFAAGFWRVLAGSALERVVEPEELRVMVQGARPRGNRPPGRIRVAAAASPRLVRGISAYRSLARTRSRGSRRGRVRTTSRFFTMVATQASPGRWTSTR